jgi:hypothetical protein
MEIPINMNLNILRPRRITAAIAILLLTSAAPTPAWCKGKQSLWLTFDHGGIVAYSSKELSKSGSPTPTELSTFASTSGVAFDKSNSLWAVVNQDEIVRFTAKQLKDLKTNPNPTPGVIITSTATFGQLSGCSFDHQGNLWVENPGNHAFFELSKDQLDAGSGDVTPPVAITSSEANGNLYMTFDADGNAWMDSWLDNTVIEFTAGQLKSGGSQSPNITLSDDGSGTSLSDPEEVTFDKDGNLWVANFLSETVVEYAKDQLTATGNPAPTVKLSGSVFDGPWGVAFNSNGSLAVVNYHSYTIDVFTPAELKTGSAAPKVILTGTGESNFQVIFGPSS